MVNWIVNYKPKCYVSIVEKLFDLCIYQSFAKEHTTSFINDNQYCFTTIGI